MAEKHLAMNVPTDLSVHVAYAQREITFERGLRRYEKDPQGWTIQRYKDCLELLHKVPNPRLAQRLLDIECVFLALLRTLDRSVPVAPLFRKYSGLSRSVLRGTTQEGGQGYVVKSLGYEASEQVPHTLDDFKKASTLAEKALIAELIVQDFGAVTSEIAKHFDYKRHRFGRGASPTYALIYGVLALAVEFESYSNPRRAAAVTLSTDGSGHEGPFLQFVLKYFKVVDPGEVGLRATDGFNERVRKISQKRKVDPDLVSLLDGEAVDAHVMLEFMSRVDALKT